MFAGEFKHTIDEKNRLVIPAKFRTFITDEGDRKGFFILASPIQTEHCLRLYTMNGWNQVTKQLMRNADGAKDPSRYLRFFSSRAEFAPIDSQSRIVVPQKLIEYAGLKDDVLMVGNVQWIEVWNQNEYRAATESLDEEIGDRVKSLWVKPE
ncbi:MAG TPA: division/cell wall cluster transcriptional repressor MraZ [Planctomycetota bacterium]